MKRLLAAGAVLVLAVAAMGAASKPPPPFTVPSNMTNLFNGTSMANFQFDPKIWSIRDKSLYGTGKWCGIFTKKSYGSFRLIVTSRLVDDVPNSGNNHLGIFFWGGGKLDSNFSPKSTGSLEIQPPTGSMWNYKTNKAISGTRMGKAPDTLYHDWHRSELLCNITTGEAKLAVDGVYIIDFKTSPASIQAGPIGFQIHSPSSHYEYKDVYIVENPKNPALETVK